MTHAALVVQADHKYLPGLQCLLATARSCGRLDPDIDILYIDDSFYHEDYSVISDLSRLKSAYYIFECFHLTEYERVVYIDTDVVCLGDINYLFSPQLNRYPFCAAVDMGSLYWAREYFDSVISRFGYRGPIINTGVMAFTPSLCAPEWFPLCLEIASTNSHYGCADQGVINELIHRLNIPIGYLPEEYNYIQKIMLSHPDKFHQDASNIKLLHYVADHKPWMCHPQDLCYKDIYQIWHDAFSQSSASQYEVDNLRRYTRC